MPRRKQKNLNSLVNKCVILGFWTVKQKDDSLNNFGYFLYIPANIYLFPGNFWGKAISTFSLLSERHTVMLGNGSNSSSTPFAGGRLPSLLQRASQSRPTTSFTDANPNTQSPSKSFVLRTSEIGKHIWYISDHILVIPVMGAAKNLKPKALNLN